MKRNLTFAFMIAFSGCAHRTPCREGNGPSAVYVTENSCDVRIKQVTIGSELPIPESLKKEDMAAWTTDWVAPEFKDGRVVFGHFVLSPKKEVPK